MQLKQSSTDWSEWAGENYRERVGYTGGDRAKEEWTCETAATTESHSIALWTLINTPCPVPMICSLSWQEGSTSLSWTSLYQQLPLDEECRSLVTINTQRGLYQYRRMPFGVASAPPLFLKTMDTILQGIDGVICYIGDIFITGKTRAEYLDRLDVVFQRLKTYGVRACKEKCTFFRSSVEHLRHKIDAEGRHPLDSKLRAITEAPESKNVAELLSFLGLLNYYGIFIPNLSLLIHPLNAFLRKDTHWSWTSECRAAFEDAKKRLVSSQIFVHYDSNLPIVLAGDASAFGVGAVLSHDTSDGRERPIAFASRAL